MTTDRWEPDPMLVDAVLAGRLDATTMPPEDRAYVVAILTENHGESADQIADRLHCSQRLIKRIRAEPLTSTLRREARTTRHLQAVERQLALLDELRARDTAEATDDCHRLREQVGQLVDELKRTRAALDHERAQRFNRAEVHVHVYRRRPTPKQIAADTAGDLLDLIDKEQ